MKCTNPMMIKTPQGRVPAPCNRCLPCRINKVDEWSKKLLAELSGKEKDAIFLTFTFEKDRKSIYKRDMQLYHKRLRKKLPKETKFKYFCCGEYGEEGKRPHYHEICIGLSKRKHKKLIDEAWGQGFVYYGTVTPASIRYVIEYIHKKLDYPEGCIPPFQLSSNNVGFEYLEKNLKDIKKNGLRINGKYTKIPKAWKNKHEELKTSQLSARLHFIRQNKEIIKKDGMLEAKRKELVENEQAVLKAETRIKRKPAGLYKI